MKFESTEMMLLLATFAIETTSITSYDAPQLANMAKLLEYFDKEAALTINVL